MIELNLHQLEYRLENIEEKVFTDHFLEDMKESKRFKKYLVERVFELEGLLVRDRRHDTYGTHLKMEKGKDFFIAFDFEDLKIIFTTFYTADLNRYNNSNRFEVLKK